MAAISRASRSASSARSLAGFRRGKPATHRGGGRPGNGAIARPRGRGAAPRSRARRRHSGHSGAVPARLPDFRASAPASTMAPLDSGVKKLRPPLRQVVVFVHHGVPNGDFEAIRRLLERALAAEPSASRGRGKGAAKAAEMASREIDKLDDRTATNEERASRKRKLILGPREFRGMRRK
jgi:hypothetical protein